MIIMGDFNLDLENMTKLAVALDLKICQTANMIPTHMNNDAAHEPYSQTDYILADTIFENTQASEELKSTTSDHLPLLSTLQLSTDSMTRQRR